MGGDSWAPIGGAVKYGVPTDGPATSAPTSLASVATPSEKGQAAVKPWSPESPMFAFGALAAITFGLMAFSTSVRLGHTTASLNLGSTK